MTANTNETWSSQMWWELRERAAAVYQQGLTGVEFWPSASRQREQSVWEMSGGYWRKYGMGEKLSTTAAFLSSHFGLMRWWPFHLRLQASFYWTFHCKWMKWLKTALSRGLVPVLGWHTDGHQCICKTVYSVRFKANRIGTHSCAALRRMLGKYLHRCTKCNDKMCSAVCELCVLPSQTKKKKHLDQVNWIIQLLCNPHVF